jgi:TRAP-type C4-dicarboxylate transport system permease small subunit
MGVAGRKGIMGNKEKRPPISNDDYDRLFGVKKLKKYDIHKEALNKAWETRNFEIDKFWQRSMFFWGFIVLISTGYVTVVTGKSYDTEKVMYLDFYLILLGIIFSFAWLFVIKGSKQWQENWEEHINYLENEITGPLYKTIYYKGKNYYSVSKITKMLAGAIIVTWFFLLGHYIYANCNIIRNLFEFAFKRPKEIIFLLLPLIGTVIFIFFMKRCGQSYGREFKKDENGAFFDINKKNLRGSGTC